MTENHDPHNCYIPYCLECRHHFNPADPNDPTKDGPVTCEECIWEMEAAATEQHEQCDCENCEECFERLDTQEAEDEAALRYLKDNL